jgi:hypothetical protein
MNAGASAREHTAVERQLAVALPGAETEAQPAAAPEPLEGCSEVLAIEITGDERQNVESRESEILRFGVR